MIITRENFEKAIRRAKAEGRKEAEKEFAAREIERNLYDSVNRSEDRIIKRLERVEREVAEVCRTTEALKGKRACVRECSSEPKIPIPTENPVR